MNDLHLQDPEQGEELAELSGQDNYEICELDADELADVAGGPLIQNGL